MHWHEQSTAHSKDNAPQRFQITHPYHPLFQQEFVLVQYRRNWGEDRVYFPAENRVSTGNANKTERSGGNTWPRWPGQNRPCVATSKPATGQTYGTGISTPT